MLLGVVFVATSLRRPNIDSYAPTPAAPHPAGDSLVGPIRYTIDASAEDEWRYFSFAQGSLIAPRTRLDWDLAFRRFHIIVNGGGGFAGKGGIVKLSDAVFDTVSVAPVSGYLETTSGKDSTNAATEHWYKYSFTSHLLRPKPDVFIVRTADGRYARLRMVSYYCPGAQPGCITFEYVFQGSGSRSLAPSR